MRLRPSTTRRTARLAPSGAQSAAWTDSSTSRGAPPDSDARASVPEVVKGPTARAPREMAISPAGDTASTEDGGNASAADSGASGRVEKIRMGAPFHAAPYTIVRASGAKRADQIVPSRNVRRWKEGRDRSAAPVPSRYAEATRAANAAATPAESHARDRRGPAETESGAPSAPLSICEKWSRTLCRSRARSRVAAYRSSGSFAMQRSTIQSNGTGTRGHSVASGSGSSRMIAARVSARVGRWNARRPESIS